MRRGALAAFAALVPISAAPAEPTASPRDGQVVSGIVITDQRPKTQVLLDRTVYLVTGNLQGVSGSVADILNEIPSVDVDADGGVSLRGDSNVTILIDGKPSAQLSGSSAGLALLQLPASQIERVEVMTNPPPNSRVATILLSGRRSRWTAFVTIAPPAA